MLSAAKAVASGEPAIGTAEPRIPHVSLASFEGMVPKGEDWRLINISEEERRATEIPSQQVETQT
jgi:phthalate 4,5-dioxygenase oxygenase subunit